MFLFGKCFLKLIYLSSVRSVLYQVDTDCKNHSHGKEYGEFRKLNCLLEFTCCMCINFSKACPVLGYSWSDWMTNPDNRMIQGQDPLCILTSVRQGLEHCSCQVLLPGALMWTQPDDWSEKKAHSELQKECNPGRGLVPDRVPWESRSLWVLVSHLLRTSSVLGSLAVCWGR